MKKLIYILTILTTLISCSADAQKKFLALTKNAAPVAGQPVLFLISGESNATGYADNGLASAPELAARNLKILNNSSYIFESLDIGGNNIINADGSLTNCPGCNTHGMELQLANSYDSGYYAIHPCYLVKAGQGGSLISAWDNGDPYYDSLVNRLDRAINLIITQTGQEPIIVWLYSHGINDMILGTTSATWKAATETLFTNIRSEINSIIGHSVVVPIIMTRFDGMTPNNQDYETVIGDIESDLTDVYPFSTSADLKDANHWQYAGMKDNVRRIKTLIQTLINL